MLHYEDFLIYHRENPDIYNMFEQFAFQAILSGRKRFGAKAVMERCRWQSMVTAKNDIFKINNNYTPFYARMFEKNNPQYKGFFSKRRSVADK